MRNEGFHEQNSVSVVAEHERFECLSVLSWFEVDWLRVKKVTHSGFTAAGCKLKCILWFVHLVRSLWIKPKPH